MLEDILPAEITSILKNRLNSEKIYELRFRGEMPVAINYNGRYYYLAKNGLTEDLQNCVMCSDTYIQNIIVRATEFSLYTVNNQLTKGFITVGGGIRIGICGELVWDGDKLKTIKNFSSLNVRVPHEVKGCSLTALSYISDTQLHNTLIIAPPGAGKTTVLRDLTRSLACEKKIRNILLVDERSEIAAVYNNRPQLDVGISTDIICNSNKTYAFSYGVRSMRPDVIITDELMGEDDVAAVRGAALSGVKVIASIHAATLDELTAKTAVNSLIKEKIFSRYVIMSDRKGPGTYDFIFDADLKCIYYGE